MVNKKETKSQYLLFSTNLNQRQNKVLQMSKFVKVSTRDCNPEVEVVPPRKRPRDEELQSKPSVGAIPRTLRILSRNGTSSN